MNNIILSSGLHSAQEGNCQLFLVSTPVINEVSF